MKKAAKFFLTGFILKVIPLWLYKILVPRRLTCFFYHVVSDTPLAHIKNIYPVVNTQQFKGALDYLSQRYKFIGYGEIEAAFNDGVDLPPNAVHLTFDDGFVECYSVIRPILLEYGISATFFITTDFIGNKVMFSANLKSLLIEKVAEIQMTEFVDIKKKIEEFTRKEINSKEDMIRLIKKIDRHDEGELRAISEILEIDGNDLLDKKPLYLDKKQLIEMNSEGFMIGAHTRSHYKLGLVDEKLMEDEIIESTKIIKKITGQKSVPFAFPNSGYGVSRDKLSQLRRENPELGLIFDSKGFNQDVEFIINRVWGEHPEFVQDDNNHKMHKIIHSAYQEAFFLQLGSIIRGSK